MPGKSDDDAVLDLPASPLRANQARCPVSATAAVVLWVIAMLASKAAQVYFFENYRKDWNKWDRMKDPVGWKLIRSHPFHELGWYVFVAVLAVFFFQLIEV